MARLFTDSKLLIASKNTGKVQELQDFLVGTKIELVSAADFEEIMEPEETGETFIENALLKAKYYCEKTGLPALADDSGLACDELGGAPGIYSARWAGPEKNFALAIARLENTIQESHIHNYDIDYTAHFVCALALCWPDGHTEAFEGRVTGKLTFPARGENGFGYDPIFVPANHHLTFGEMNKAEKQAISHRSKAFRQLMDNCFSQGTTDEKTAANK